MALTLILGNRTYSSWSLRAWLYMRASGLSFAEVRIPMFTPTWEAEVRKVSPAGRVPVLLDGDLVVWDSLAIMEHLLEKTPGAVGWPSDPKARARARSVSAEMHGGFMAVRGELPQNLRRRAPTAISVQARQQIDRITEIWRSCRAEFGEGGPWLFGGFSIADVMYTPVALRFVSYQIPLGPVEAGYVRAVEEHPAVREWALAAKAEVETIPAFDDVAPLEQTSVTLG
jgi:glutathione S-transferase